MNVKKLSLIVMFAVCMSLSVGCSELLTLTLSKPEQIAKELVTKNLTSPSSANWNSFNIIEQNGDQYVVHVTLESQNGFGAMVSGSYIVLFSYFGGDNYTYNPMTYITECSNPPLDMEVNLLKTLNKAATQF